MFLLTPLRQRGIENDSEVISGTVAENGDEKNIFEELRRCTKCILPETFPGIEFDDEGVCNYCRNYVPVKVFGEVELIRVLERFRGKGEKYDCLVPISGGRDSTFALHQMIRRYEMRVLAITVDTGAISP